MNIFVAKLSFNTEEADLRDAFEEYGEVSSVKIIIDKFTGRSKGFGFVEMDNDDEAQNAIAELNDAELDGRTIVVKKAEPRERRDNRGGGRGGYGGGGRGGYGGGGGGGRGGDRYKKMALQLRLRRRFCLLILLMLQLPPSVNQKEKSNTCDSRQNSRRHRIPINPITCSK